MKANELMIGDWVEYRFTGWTEKGGFYKNYQYVRISTIGRLYVKADHDRVASADGEEFFPISLTPEILEENGFQKQSDYQWKYRDNGCKIVISIAPQIEIEGEILGEPPINMALEGALFDIDITSDCYVHTLQHALRLCGIEKEITI